MLEAQPGWSSGSRDCHATARAGDGPVREAPRRRLQPGRHLGTTPLPCSGCKPKSATAARRRTGGRPISRPSASAPDESFQITAQDSAPASRLGCWATPCRTLSPGGAAVNSQGRQPLGRGRTTNPQPRRGDSGRAMGRPCRPSGAERAVAPPCPGADTPGYSRPPSGATGRCNTTPGDLVPDANRAMTVRVRVHTDSNAANTNYTCTGPGHACLSGGR
jgi:hypothetical protein